MMTIASLLTTLLLPSALATRPNQDLLPQAYAAYRASEISDVAYALSFFLDDTATRYHGTATVHFTRKPSPADLTLDYQGEKVSSVQANGQAVPVAYNGSFITIPSRFLQANNQVTVQFEANYSNTGDGLSRFVDPLDQKIYLHTNLEPYGAHRVFPCFDQPDLKATFEVAVELPRKWVAIANMPPKTIEKVRSDHWKRLTFPKTPKLSTYLFALHAGEYEAWHDKAGDIPMALYARASLAKHVDSADIFHITRQGLAFFSRYFDTPYPFAKYDQVLVPELAPGAMENPGAVTLTERFIFRHKVTDRDRFGRDNVILHEMAHMWFGDLVTMRWWNDLWLNESFATYLSFLAGDQIRRFGDPWLNFHGTKLWAYATDEKVTTHPIEADIPDTHAATTHFDGITYGKGASVFKQLAYFIGPDAFRDGVRHYFKQHAWQNATLKDFMAALQTKTQENLSSWTHDWLQTSGLNTVRPEWGCENGYISRFDLVQGVASGDAKLRPHRLEIGLFGVNKAGYVLPRARVAASYAGSRTAVEALKGKPCPDIAIANVGDHDYARVRLDPESLRMLKFYLGRTQDVLVRQQVWTALWDMLRDQELRVPAYLDLLTKHLLDETDPVVAGTQLERLPTALFYYLDTADRAKLAPKIEAFVWDGLNAQQAGGDAQIVWANTYVAIARTPQGLSKLRALLDSKGSPNGLEVNQDMRWNILESLASAGDPAVTRLLEAEKTRDPSDRGLKAADRTLAAQPKSEVKAAFWNRFLHDQTTSLGHLKEPMRSFFRLDQEAVTGPFVKRYFDEVAGLYQKRGHDYAHAFARRLFPFIARPEVLKQSQDFLQRRDLSPELRRLILENNQELERTLKIRQLAKESP